MSFIDVFVIISEYNLILLNPLIDFLQFVSI